MPIPGQDLWTRLIADCSESPTADNWNDLRDSKQIDFGRGFMGFDVLKTILGDLHASKNHFGHLILGWRGDPLLHPEIEPILHYLARKQNDGLFDRLQIETTVGFHSKLIVHGLKPIGFYRSPQPRRTRAVIFKSSNFASRAILCIDSLEGVTEKDLLVTFPAYTLYRGDFPEASLGHVIWDRRHLSPSLEQKSIAISSFTRPSFQSFDVDKTTQAIVSWDAKMTLDFDDKQLYRVYADLNHESIRQVWSDIGSKGH